MPPAIRIVDLEYLSSEQLPAHDGHKQGIEQGIEQGKLAEKAQSILTVLSARGFAVSDEDRTRVQSCRDGALLDQWLIRAATAASASAAIEGD